MTSVKRIAPACTIFMLALLSAVVLQAQTPVFVELNSPAPTAVARYEAAKAGKPFDQELHRASIRVSQDNLLAELAAAGANFTVSSTSVVTAAGNVTVPSRYSELINAIRLLVTPEHVAKIRANPKVRHITLDEPRKLVLNNSAGYVRANGADSARSRGFRGSGQVNADGSATGQVIAVLDTGIDHTHPMFDSRFDDSQSHLRTGDLRPVRLQGSPYVAGVNHPKVAYRFLFSTAPAEGDDTGHGTSVASVAAGLKVQADSTLNNGEVLEGIAPGAVLLDYKVCPSLACTNEQVLLALEDAARDRDMNGFPKPRATVVNMSFGDTAGDPNSADAVAAGNLQFLGVFPEASAGNGCDLVEDLVFGVCLTENIVGSPAAGRLVVATAATTDPGVAPNSVDVLGADGSTLNKFLAAFATESNATTPISSPITEHYVFAGFADTAADVPDEVNGRICLTERGGTVGLFGVKANNCHAKGAIAMVVFNNVPGPIGNVLAPSAIPVFTISQEDGQSLLGFGFSGEVSNLPIRINPADAALFRPETAGFSSRGPNNDFLVVKPDLTAPGVSILMAASKIGALGDPRGFTSADGTSFSGPHIAGAAALVRDTQGGRQSFSPSLVRAILMNSTTHLRESSGASIADGDDRNFIHATGAGLAEMVRAVDLKAIMGTNELNGPGGADDPSDPNFLPSYSFGEQRLIGTGLLASDLRQQRTITATLADIGGAGGSYTLRIVDGGALRGTVTRSLNEPGFNLSLSQTSVSIPAGGKATYRVNVSVDGTANGLKIAGFDQIGLEATEFLWWVIAEPAGGGVPVRMPFFFRAARGVAGGGAVGSSIGKGWIQNGDSKGHFSFAADEASGGKLNYEDRKAGIRLKGSVSSMTVSGFAASFGGACTLSGGSNCEYKVDVQDNADPGKGADRFAIKVTTANGGLIHQAEGLLGAGNIDVRKP